MLINLFAPLFFLFAISDVNAGIGITHSDAVLNQTSPNAIRKLTFLETPQNVIVVARGFE
tara:strand:+ start:935 stop:1114 length:180 start_codon:yes stop_codon:yes gene_type:complete